MTKKINKIKLYVKENSFSMIIANLLKEKLVKNNFKIVEDNYDLAVSIGGDGTFLGMISKNNFLSNVIYVGINSGNLGYLQNIDVDKIDKFVRCLKNDEFHVDKLSYLDVELLNKNEKKHYYCLNELVLRNQNFKAINVSIYIENNLLEKVFGDGILISTPTGSAAYNLSVGGPIIYDGLDLYTLTPIAPINNCVYKSLRNSLVIPGNKEATLIPENKSSISFVCDGSIIECDGINKVNIKLNSNKINVLRLNDYCFEKLINKKIIN